MIRVGVCGAPSTGKTTLAESLSAHYKRTGKHKRVELIVEYAREFVTKFKSTKPSDQLHIFHEQLRREKMAQGADLMITDSPVWLAAIYACIGNEPYDDLTSHYLQKILEEVIPIMHTNYDLIFYLPFSLKLYDKVKAEDGKRIHCDLTSLNDIDIRIQGMINMFQIPYYKIDSIDSQKRVKEAVDVIDECSEYSGG